VWHANTADLQEQGRLQFVGIIQEQHPDRARLFMQWQQMDWPILVDSLNLLGVSAVPITLLIDEQGIVRAVQPKEKELREFLDTDYSADSNPATVPERRIAGQDLIPSKPGPDASASSWREYGDALFLWQDASRLDAVIDSYKSALEKAPEHAANHFRLGVAYRARHDSNHRRPGDFQKAVDSWKHALDLNPNQYIWRRRIQQYGPRLDKPYPFYDWVHTAREEIKARGEEPVALSAPPSGESESG
jgi:tetratricopeptide (TPR) repeat protein